MSKTNVQAYFDHHPGVDTFYFTSDGQAFFSEHEAENHARNLAHAGKDASIERADRDEQVKYDNEPGTAAQNEPADSTENTTAEAANSLLKKGAPKKK